jgi:hypothetical protein
VFAYIQKKQVVTKKELLAQKFSYFDVTRILTPRNIGVDASGKPYTKGDPQGHPATFGELYYMEKLEGKRFRLRWRKVALAPIRESVRGKVEAKKVVTTAETKTPASVTA